MADVNDEYVGWSSAWRIAAFNLVVAVVVALALMASDLFLWRLAVLMAALTLGACFAVGTIEAENRRGL